MNDIKITYDKYSKWTNRNKETGKEENGGQD